MLSVLVIEDEKRVLDFLSEILKREGYKVFEEALSAGLIRVVKKEERGSLTLLENKYIVDLEKIFKEGLTYRDLLARIEKPLIETVLERLGGNQVRSARLLGLNRNTLRTKIKKLGIDIRGIKSKFYGL